MITDWLSDDGRKAIEIMGWPEWTEDVALYTLTCERVDFWVDEVTHPGGYSRGSHAIRQHEALCLLRNAAREWLIEQWRSDTIWKKVIRFIRRLVRAFLRKPEDYDPALVAAILAASEQARQTEGGQAGKRGGSE